MGRLLAALVLFVLLQGAEATTWTVGGSKGWALNVDYSQWLQGKVFEVGDVLLFTYNKTKENVLEVSEADYATCTVAEPIAFYSDGNTSVALKNDSTRYFISGVAGHCLDGMTLQIQMGARPPAPAPAPTPARTSSPAAPPSLSSPSVSPPLPQDSPPPSLPNSASSHLIASVASAIGTAFLSPFIV